MTTRPELARAAATMFALLPPASGFAQDAATPAGGEFDLAPVLLGAGSVVLVVVTFVLLRELLRRGAAQAGDHPPVGRQLQRR
jgi:hypothetical protein